ncbi:MAG: NAD-dependent epimerase/dehydratase family protein [Anaerolineae bacterium]|nr:NAD-dependent epimerase/dehydratase family protein [Anaerolineae bacterium]
MRKKAILITGASGEIGQALITSLSQMSPMPILTLDLHPVPQEFMSLCNHISGDILDHNLLARLVTEYDFEMIFHLAALLSTRSEFSPELAHQVNVDGTLALLQVAAEQSQRRGKPVRFIFPSSIAAYGMPNLATKERDRSVKEWQWNNPTTMYGCNKLYCEQLGIYYSKHYQQLSANKPVMLDFRSLRFPGLISAFTMPSGGTTDYGPEMLHAAAKGERYACFVREDSVLPFMAMPDAVTALLQLSAAPVESLNHLIYNVTSFSISASDFRDHVLRAFPQAQITFDPDWQRQGIVDSWPAELNDEAARRDWGWAPAYNLQRAFDEYLVPNIHRRYHR